MYEIEIPDFINKNLVLYRFSLYFVIVPVDSPLFVVILYTSIHICHSNRNKCINEVIHIIRGEFYEKFNDLAPF